MPKMSRVAVWAPAPFSSSLLHLTCIKHPSVPISVECLGSTLILPRTFHVSTTTRLSKKNTACNVAQAGTLGPVALLSTSCLQPYQSTKAVSASSFLNSPLVLVRHVFHSSFLPESKDPSEHRCLPAHDHLHLFLVTKTSFTRPLKATSYRGLTILPPLPLQTGGLASIQVCFSFVFFHVSLSSHPHTSHSFVSASKQSQTF